MKVLFMSLGDYSSINERGIYTDLLRKFISEGSEVYILSPIEQMKKEKTHVIKEKKSTIVKVYTGKIQKTNIIEKGINTLLIEKRYIKALKKNFNNINFDLVLYPTPPITLVGVVKYVKKRDNSQTYLLLKDIFPQNAVDIGMLQKTGLKGILYKYFRNKEKQLYAVSDYIGCMSEANRKYILNNNQYIDSKKIKLCPNCIEPINMSVSDSNKISIREKYGIPLDKLVFVYGGNLGKPQGIDFLISCLKSQKENQNVFFLIIGNGTEYSKLNKYVKEANQNNLKLMNRLPKIDYDRMIGSCDVGMIFLDYKFTIPNFPSRLLSYMQAKLPVLAVTDTSSDIGQVIVDGHFGWWCESNSVAIFDEIIKEISRTKNLKKMGEFAYKYLCENYSTSNAYTNIMKTYKKGDNYDTIQR